MYLFIQYFFIFVSGSEFYKILCIGELKLLEVFDIKKNFDIRENFVFGCEKRGEKGERKNRFYYTNIYLVVLIFR